MNIPIGRGFILACTLAASAAAEEAPVPTPLIVGEHVRLPFDENVERVAVGDDSVLSFEVIDSREVLLLGRKPGRTTLTVWLSGGRVDVRTFAVQRDLSVLARALKDVDPAIEVEMAPDRDAVVLRGRVPTINERARAGNMAEDYLSAGQRRQRHATSTSIIATPASPPASEGAQTPANEARVSEEELPSGRVLNLITLAQLPPKIEERVQDAIRALGADGVAVHRIQRGDLRDDATDVLVLDGDVRDQTMLTRCLHLAARIFLDQDLKDDDVKVIADEAGALTTAKNDGFSGSQQPSFLTGSFGSTSATGGVAGGSGSRSATGRLGNRIGKNLARATVVSVAGGRILSYLHVDDLPQVRVDVRLWEIDRHDLRSYAPQFTTIFGDFGQGTLNPSSEATLVQGDAAARVGSASRPDVQNVLGFLADGLNEELQITGKHFAIDAAFQLLQTRGLARSLSQPSLTVLSGEQARFQVGGEVPVPQSFSPALGTTSTTTPGVFSSVVFEPFGVELGVRPLVADDGTVTLDVVSLVSEPDATLTTTLKETTGTSQLTTAFDTRALGTSTRLEDGGALLIGGLISRKSNDDASFAPWFADLPVLGWLFKRYSVKDDDEELVVVVTPSILRDPIPDLGVWAFPEFPVVPVPVSPGPAAQSGSP